MDRRLHMADQAQGAAEDAFGVGEEQRLPWPQDQHAGHLPGLRMTAEIDKVVAAAQLPEDLDIRRRHLPQQQQDADTPVSYTHLTLPTKA